MIPKSGYRFSEKIMRKQKAGGEKFAAGFSPETPRELRGVFISGCR
jgi:hypothetical protein